MGNVQPDLELTSGKPTSQEAPPNCRTSAGRDDRLKNYPSSSRFPRTRSKPAGRALHGLRRALLPHRLPAGQHHPRLQRPRVPRSLAEAAERLHATNNFPEFTGRLCPAPCEEACVLGLNDPPVTIEQIEKEIVERAFAEGWIRPEPPERAPARRWRSSAPAPPAWPPPSSSTAPATLVTVFERDDRIGGLLRYGIPDFKMEKAVIDRRVCPHAAGGHHLQDRRERGRHRHAGPVEEANSTPCLRGGATRARDLKRAEGRDLKGVVLAMEFPAAAEQGVAGDRRRISRQIKATGKNVIVIGGGDTGSDCIGTSMPPGRLGHNFELLPMPPKGRPANQPWPFYPMKLPHQHLARGGASASSAS
jgi:glutamate synthase (NADPH/NADH) small chain